MEELYVMGTVDYESFETGETLLRYETCAGCMSAGGYDLSQVYSHQAHRHLVARKGL